MSRRNWGVALLVWGALAPIGVRAQEKGKPAGSETGWVALFNGKDLEGWEAYDRRGKQSDVGTNWVVKDGVILGTGVGAGIVVRGGILTGPNAIAGEWGHNPMPWPRDGEWPGPPCFCGRTGCIELFLSGPALEREQLRASAEPLTAHEIALVSF